MEDKRFEKEIHLLHDVGGNTSFFNALSRAFQRVVTSDSDKEFRMMHTEVEAWNKIVVSMHHRYDESLWMAGSSILIEEPGKLIAKLSHLIITILPVI